MAKFWELAPPGYKLRLDIEKKRRKLIPPWLQEEPDFGQPPDFVAEEQAGLTALAGTNLPSVASKQPLSGGMFAERQGYQPPPEPEFSLPKWWQANETEPGAAFIQNIYRGRGIKLPDAEMVERYRQETGPREKFIAEMFGEPSNLLPFAGMGEVAARPAAALAGGVSKAAKRVAEISTADQRGGIKLPGGAGKAPKGKIPGQAPLAQAAPPVREGVDEAVESAIREAKPPAAESATAKAIPEMETTPVRQAKGTQGGPEVKLPPIEKQILKIDTQDNIIPIGKSIDVEGTLFRGGGEKVKDLTSNALYFFTPEKDYADYYAKSYKGKTVKISGKYKLLDVRNMPDRISFPGYGRREPVNLGELWGLKGFNYEYAGDANSVWYDLRPETNKLLSSALRENGYDGIAWREISGSIEHNSIALLPEKVKYTAPKPIPPTKVAQVIPPEIGVTQRDIQELQKIAQEANQPIETPTVYGGTLYRGIRDEETHLSDGGFFGIGEYYSTSPEIAEIYGKKIITSPSDLKNPLFLDASYEKRNVVVDAFWEKYGNVVDVKELKEQQQIAYNITKKLKAEGYDGVVVKYDGLHTEVVKFPDKMPSLMDFNMKHVEAPAPELVPPTKVAQGEAAKVQEWFHGSKKEIDKFALSYEAPGKGVENLFGEGLYITDNPTVAGTYAKSEGIIYKIGLKTDLKLLDLEKPLPTDAQEAFINFAKFNDQFLGSVTDVDVKRWFTEGKTGAEIYKRLADDIVEMPQSEAIEAFGELVSSLQSKGYEGFSHMGGRFAGKGKTLHNVRILWNPQDAITTRTAVVKPTVEAAPHPGAGVTPPVKPPRQPNYNAGERATETVPAVPPRQPPPIDTTPIPTETPSGRKPGGIGRQTELPAVDEYSKHVEALTPTKTALRDKVTDFRDNLVRNFADRNSPLAELEKITGIPTHKLAQVVPGGTGAGEDIVRTQFRPAWKPVTKDVDYLEQYMVAMRDQDILARNRSANLPGSVQGWEGTLKAMEGLKNKIGPERYAAIEKAAKELWRLNDEQVLTPLVNEGILSKEAYQAMKSSNPHYIPFQREDFLTGIESHFVTPEASVSSTGIKHMDLAGSKRKLDQPLARLEAGVIRSQQTIFRNRAAKSIVAALQDLETQTGAPILKYIEPKRELRTIERVTGEKIPRGIKGEHSQNRETIGFFQDGKKVVVEVPALYGEVAKSLDWPVSNLLSKVIMTVNAPLRHGATTYAPSFLVSNPFGDAFSAFFQTGLIPLSPHYFKGWAAAVKKNPLYSEAARSGVFMSGLVETASDMTALKRVQSIGSITVHNPKDALLLVPRLLRKANIISEQATRAAVYSRSIAQGLSQLESAIMARNATVDFSKMGPVMRIINQVIPFTNPALQGTINLGGRIKRNPVSALLVASPFATATVLTRVNNMRFETSKDIPQYEYTNYWVIQTGEGTHKNGTKFPIYFKLPKRQVGSILSWPAELTFNILQKQNNRSTVEMVLDSSIETAKTLSPIEPAASGVLPPPVQTGMGLEANKNFFTGQPIVPEYQKNLPAEEQFTERTSETATVIGQAVNVSPAKIDFAIKDYLAGAGQSGLWLTDLALNAVGIKNGEADPSFVEKLAQAPVTGRLVGTKQTQQGEKRQLAEQQFPEEVAALKPGEPLPPGVKSQVELSPEWRAKKEQAGRATPEDKIKWEDYDKRVKRDNEYRQARMSPTDWRDTFHNDNLVRMAQSEFKERLGMIRKKDRKNMSDTEKVLDDYYTMMENLSDPVRTGRLKQEARFEIELWEAKLTDKQRQDLRQNLHPRATDMEKEYYTDMDNLKPYFDVTNKSPLITDKGKTKAMNDIAVLENRARQLQVAGDWQGAQMAAYEAQKLDAIYQITGWRKYLAAQRKMLRGQNPEIDRLLVKWGYASKPLQPLPAPTPKRELAGVR